MSTKATIGLAETWHLYKDILSGEVYLEMNDAKKATIKVDGRWHAVIIHLPDVILEAISEYVAIDKRKK